MLEIMGEVVYKAVAYRRVADAIERYPEDVASLYRRGTPPKLPGAGPALSPEAGGAVRDRAAWPTTTSCARRCRTACWRSCRSPASGRARSSCCTRSAASTPWMRCGPRRPTAQLRGIKGLSERTEQNILAGIARLEQKVTRVLLHEADEMIGGLIARLRDVPGVVRIEPAGSLRRRKATIGDLDLLAATDEPAGADRRAGRPDRGRSDPVGRHRQVEHRAGRRAAGRPDGLPAGGVGHATWSTSPAARSTTSRCAAWPWIAA